MLYVLDHYYAINHQQFCIVLESDRTIDDIVEICSAIAFLLEDLTDVSSSLDMDCLLSILVTYYGAINKKDDITDEMLHQIQMPIEGVYKEIFLAHDCICVSKAYIVDLYEARESCCGNDYKKIMEKWLPKGKQLEELKQLLYDRGVEV